MPQLGRSPMMGATTLSPSQRRAYESASCLRGSVVLTPREKILASSGDARLLGRALLSPSLRQEKCHYTRYIIDRSSVSISTICSGCQLNVEAHPYRFVFETTCRHRVTPIDLFWYERVPQEEFRTGESN
jgi:hypothetical protein